MSVEPPPRCESPREFALLRRMCERAEVEFSEWQCARMLTEFKRNLTAGQWKALREDPDIVKPEDALQALIVFGFENRRLKRMRLRGRGRDRIWAEDGHKRRMRTLMRGESRGVQGRRGTKSSKSTKSTKSKRR